MGKDIEWLAKADEHIVRQRSLIDAQKRRIHDLARHGHDTESAMLFLHRMEAFLASLETHRKIIIGQIARRKLMACGPAPRPRKARVERHGGGQAEESVNIIYFANFTRLSRRLTRPAAD